VTASRSKAASLGIVTVSYAIALAVAAAWLMWGPATGRLWLDTLIADALGTLVVFAFSRAYGNSSFYDAYWSVVPPLLLFYWWSQAAEPDPLRCWLAAAVVVAWAVRLTGNWVYAFPGLHHEDWRYPMFRDRAGRFEFVADLVAIHLIPTLQVFLGMVPVYIAVTTPGRGWPWLAAIAFVVGVAAVALELIADVQMHRFARIRRPGEVMDRGLWAWSRHPNYFGEFSFWFALALFGVAAAPGDAWWLFVGAAAMLAMFLGASIPMMEERSVTRRPGYADVVDRVSRFVPRPPRRARV
jgi:steroid 5-alpha reductase family enzyme